MVDWVDIGSTLTFDFLDYTLNEIQKIILLVKGEESNENTSIDSDTITFFGTAFFKNAQNYIDYDIALFPGMPENYNFGKNFRKSTIIPSGSTEIGTWNLYSSGISSFTYTGSSLKSGDGLMNWVVPFRSNPVVSSSFTFGWENSPSPTFAPTVSSSDYFNIGYAYTGIKKHFFIANPPNIAVPSSNPDNKGVIIRTTGGYTFDEIRNIYIDNVPDYVPPTWDQLISGEYYIPDFYPSELPVVSIPEQPFKLSIPENVPGQVHNYFELGLSSLSSVGLLSFFLTIVLLRILIFSFKRR